MPEPIDAVKRLEDTDNLLDIMIQVEDYFDSLDLYVFKNFIDGELVNGPYVKRYWVTFTLKYPYTKMPDPQGGLRLLKYGSKVSYEKASEEVPVPVKSVSDLDPETQRPKMKKEPIWLVHFKIPRRFIEELNIEGLDLYDDDPLANQDPTSGEMPAEEPVPSDEAPSEDGADAASDMDLDLEI